jgi:hypothetical protein
MNFLPLNFLYLQEKQKCQTKNLPPKRLADPPLLVAEKRVTKILSPKSSSALSVGRCPPYRRTMASLAEAVVGVL